MKTNNRGIHDFSYHNNTHTMITSYTLNPIMHAETHVSYNLRLLSPRMRTMLINQFKRGYSLSPSSGQLNSMSSILCERHDIPPLYFLGEYSGVFKNPPKELEQWLKATALLLNFSVQSYRSSKISVTYNFFENNDMSTKKRKSIVKEIRAKIKDTPEYTEHKQKRLQIIEEIEKGATITVSTRYN